MKGSYQMDLLTLNQLADRIGMSYKRLYLRLDQSSGIINVAGKSIPAYKDKGQWLIWLADYENAGPAEKKQPKLKPVPIKNIKSKPVKSGVGVIDPSRSGMG